MSVPVIVVTLLLPLTPVVGVPCAAPVTPLGRSANEGRLLTTALAVNLVKKDDQRALGMVSGPVLGPENASAAEDDQHDIVVTSRRIVPGDPFQVINAKSFAVTQDADKALVGPVSLAYKEGIPEPIRNGFTNFVGNLHEPTVLLNFLLQVKIGKAVETLGRFAINSTIGGAGLFDIAKRRPFNLPRRLNGFADTLGYYGVKSGPFMFLPFVGPTTARDLLGNLLDRLLLPFAVGKPFNRLWYTLPTGVVSVMDRRSRYDDQIEMLRSTADPYASSRELYLRRRQAEIDELRGHRRGDTSSVSHARHGAIALAQQ